MADQPAQETVAEAWGYRQFERALGTPLKELAPSTRVAILGGGISGLWVQRLCEERGLTVAGHLDDYPDNCLPGMAAKPIREVHGLAPQAVILATLRSVEALTQRLAEANYRGRIVGPAGACAATPSGFKFSAAPQDRNGLPGRDWPLNVQIQTHSACNARCVICPHRGSWNDRHRGPMEAALFDKIVDDLGHYRIGKLCLYLQNEPFVDVRWFEWARRAIRELSFQRFEVSTNLVALAPARIPELLDLLSPIPHEVWISFHGVDRASYERIMGLDFDKALERLEIFVREAARRNITYRVHGFGLPIDAAHRGGDLFDKDAYNRFFRTFEAERGLPAIPVRFFKYHDRAGNVTDPAHHFAFHRPELKDFYCHRLDTWLHVRYNGDVILCCDDYERETVIGDLKHQSVREFFRSEPYRTCRDQGLGLIPSPHNFICKRCIKPGG